MRFLGDSHTDLIHISKTMRTVEDDECDNEYIRWFMIWDKVRRLGDADKPGPYGKKDKRRKRRLSDVEIKAANTLRMARRRGAERNWRPTMTASQRQEKCRRLKGARKIEKALTGAQRIEKYRRSKGARKIDAPVSPKTRKRTERSNDSESTKDRKRTRHVQYQRKYRERMTAEERAAAATKHRIRMTKLRHKRAQDRRLFEKELMDTNTVLLNICASHHKPHVFNFPNLAHYAPTRAINKHFVLFSSC